MSGTWCRYFFDSARTSLNRHLLRPVQPVLVSYDKGYRRAECLPEADSRKNLHLIRLDFHSSAAAIALLSPPELVIDVLRRYFDPGWNSLHYAYQRLTEIGR